MELFTGAGTALVTPFTKEGNVNYDSLERLIEFQIGNKIDAIISLGTTGEASTLTNDEYKEIVNFTIKKVNKRVPVIVGTGSNNTITAVEKSEFAQSAGADGVLVVTPYYNKTTQNGLIAHYEKIARSINIPLIIYNVPGRTGLNIEPKTVYELSKIPNISGVKEASNNIAKISLLSSLCGDVMNIYSGCDEEVLPILAVGGKGVISTMANIIPSDTHEIVSKFFEGDIIESRKLQFKYLELISNLFSETNPIPIKAALNYMGFEVGAPRLPLVPMSDTNSEKLKSNLKALGLI